jgi:TRAP-type C4-dicarboxylate transport system permease small subunit
MIIKKAILFASIISAIFSFAVAATPAYAQTANELRCGVNAAAGQNGCGNNGTDAVRKVNQTIGTVVNIISSLAGVVAVIMIIVGGFRYITSSGDSAKTASARNTITYAAIGLAIVALAQVIVRYVLHLVT